MAPTLPARYPPVSWQSTPAHRVDGARPDPVSALCGALIPPVDPRRPLVRVPLNDVEATAQRPACGRCERIARLRLNREAPAT